MMLRVLIVDDEPLARARLHALLGDCQESYPTVVSEVQDAMQAIALLHSRSFDVVFLDIHMPGADGTALAQQLKGLPNAPQVIFVTAYMQHAVKAFELDAVDYLTKPVRLQRLQKALQKLHRLKQMNVATEAAQGAAVDALVITKRNRTFRVPLSKVVYFKAELKYVTVRTQESSYVLDSSLNQLEERFPQRFLRVHRNALVAPNAVRALQRQTHAVDGEGWVLSLVGIDDVLAVSRRQVPAVRDALRRS